VVDRGGRVEERVIRCRAAAHRRIRLSVEVEVSFHVSLATSSQAPFTDSTSPLRRHYLASTGPIPFGVGGWFHAAKNTAHIFNATVSTVRSAMALKEVYEAIQKAEEAGVSDEEKRKLEDRAAQMGLNALFKVRVVFFLPLLVSSAHSTSSYSLTGRQTRSRIRHSRSLRPSPPPLLPLPRRIQAPRLRPPQARGRARHPRRRVLQRQEGPERAGWSVCWFRAVGVST
jgi:hypothetical protein